MRADTSGREAVGHSGGNSGLPASNLAANARRSFTVSRDGSSEFLKGIRVATHDASFYSEPGSFGSKLSGIEPVDEPVRPSGRIAQTAWSSFSSANSVKSRTVTQTVGASAVHAANGTNGVHRAELMGVSSPTADLRGMSVAAVDDFDVEHTAFTAKGVSISTYRETAGVKAGGIAWHGKPSPSTASGARPLTSTSRKSDDYKVASGLNRNYQPTGSDSPSAWRMTDVPSPFPASTPAASVAPVDDSVPALQSALLQSKAVVSMLDSRVSPVRARPTCSQQLTGWPCCVFVPLCLAVLWAHRFPF